jgi:uncharacterized iron-regulated membrane protein
VGNAFLPTFYQPALATIFSATMFDLTLKNRRKLWLKIHLYLGLFAGAVFVIIGLTGSILAFEYPLDEALNAEIMTVPVTEKLMPLDDIVAAGLKAVPVNAKALNIDFPKRTELAYALWFEQPSDNPDFQTRHQIFINPYTAKVTGQRLLIDFEHIWRDPFKDFVLRLHYTLALGEQGMTIVGFIGIGLFFSVLTGLIVWWPLGGHFKKALTIKRHASSERFNFDLHKTVGFYSAIVLLYLTASGVYLIFPDYGRNLVNVFSPVTDSPWNGYQSTVPQDKKTPIPLSKVVAITDARFPTGEYCWIAFPQQAQDAYVIGKRESTEVNQYRLQRWLWIDQYSGKILHSNESNTRTAGDIFEEWLFPLHTGEAFGVTGQLIILITGLIPLLLYVTGVIRWLQKRRAKKHSVGQLKPGK